MIQSIQTVYDNSMLQKLISILFRIYLQRTVELFPPPNTFRALKILLKLPTMAFTVEKKFAKLIIKNYPQSVKLKCHRIAQWELLQ